VHAPQEGRLVTALAQVQAILVESTGWLKRRATQIVWSERQPSENGQDPVLAMLEAAPVDDEPVTDDDRWHIEEGRRAYRSGQVLSAEEVRRGCLGIRGDKNRTAEDQVAAV
jgi:hypothetical protein